MGIKLDWDIEADQSHVRNTGEDPESQRARRRARARLILLVVGLLLAIGAVVGGIALRLRQVEYETEQRLRATVDAEVAALRIGDRTSFLSVQRSATDDWLLAQEAAFDQYQTLKAERDVSLTGRVLSLEVDNSRARVEVEEIIDGVPFKRVWFYWQYDDGWRHVPPDYTFWGDVGTVSAGSVSVRYRAVDAPLANAVGESVNSWVEQGCGLLNCANLPQISVEIIPDDALQPGWSAANPWLLQVPSPAARRARVDAPFSGELRNQVALLVADRLVAQASNNMQPAAPSDAAYLRQAIVDWLADGFARVQTDSHLIESLAVNYGTESVARLVQSLQPASDLSLLVELTGVASLEQASLDWRDFLTWRLNLEQTLLAARDEASFLALYDSGDESARSIALGRFNAPPPAENKVVVSISPQVDSNGVPHLYARVQSGNELAVREEEVIFRLVGGGWRRVN